MSHEPNKGLPPFAVEYLAECPAARTLVRAFYIWLKGTSRGLGQLEPAEITRYAELALVAKKPRARSSYRRRFFRFLDWLRARELLSFDPRCLWPRSDFELPPQALSFLKERALTLKKSTVNGNRTALRQFHIWLNAQSQPLDGLERNHIVSWLQWLHDRDLSAAQRVQSIQLVRSYLRWREEQPHYSGPSADALIRVTDFPKLPQYLPRPLPADVDRLLQRRLRKSNALPQLGLLLMRRTGLRIGELRALPLHCVHSDHLGREFLKVPLGKLNNERLVPLDKITMRLIRKLRAFPGSGRPGQRRKLLLQEPSGKPIPYAEFRQALKRSCHGLVLAEPMTSHRLRHTYATVMLAAGVSIPVLMKLLGHRSYRMTLRYAAITIETVAVEHADAFSKIEERYALQKPVADRRSPETGLSDVARYLLKQVDDAGLDNAEARVVVRRINRLSSVVQRLLRDCAAQRSRRSE